MPEGCLLLLGSFSKGSLLKFNNLITSKNAAFRQLFQDPVILNLL